MRTLALIPARAGSKGIPGKNRRRFDGIPLAERAWLIGHEMCDFAYITTDEPYNYHGEVLGRPADLAKDDTPMLAVVEHAIEALAHKEPDVIVLLQPTQPLRTKQHVFDALRLLEETGADSVVSVVQIPAHYSPDCALDCRDGFLYPFDYEVPSLRMMPTRRQDARPAYSRDGTVYAIKRQTIEKGSLYGSHCVPLIIPSHESVNLDTEEDWQRAETMVRK